MKIPEGHDECPHCGWQKTTEHFAPAKHLDFEEEELLEKRKTTTRLLFGCLTLAIFTIALLMTGAFVLFQHRATAYKIWSTNIEKKGGKQKKTPDELESIRVKLLSISGKISRIDDGAPYNPIRIKKELKHLESELKKHRKEPDYLRVYGLLKSVSFQLKITEHTAILTEIPPLPYSPIVPKHHEEYVFSEIKGGDLIMGKIIHSGSSKFFRYGPASFRFSEKLKKLKRLYYLPAPGGYVFVEMVIGVKGKAQLIEYTTRMLDDYRRAFPPFLDGEKELRRRKLTRNHAIWRDTPETEKSHPLYLHRIFILPSDHCKSPILEIKRQGASKKLWVQY